MDIHTDNVGPDFGDMACNMLLRGNGSLSIQEVPGSEEFLSKHLEKGKCVIFNSQRMHYATNTDSNALRYLFYADFDTTNAQY